MSWEFVYCPSCGASQEKVGGCVEMMFCTECCNEWVEPAVQKPIKASKKPKKLKRLKKNKG